MEKCVLNKIEQLLPGSNVHFDVPLASMTSFKIGGPASVVICPGSELEAASSLQFVLKENLPWKLMGNGSNILAPDSGYDGVVFLLNHCFHPMSVTGASVICSAGESLASVSKAAVCRHLSGMEGLSGIPGTIGGACAMNAGAYGYEIKQIVRKLRVLHNGEISDISVSEADFGVRSSTYHAPEYIILGAEFQLAEDDGLSKKRMDEYTEQRRSKQPLELPSAGSVFKRPKGSFAGTLIESCGLKGLRAGGAEVSTKHAGFIVNTGNATEKDVKELVSIIQDRVFAETGYRLERELKYFDEV